MSELLKVFVYGTLKVGGRFAGRFDSERVSTKKGTMKGTMFSLGGFPGLILDGENTITGEVHEYTDAKKVEERFDRIEGYLGPDHKHNLYNKAEVEVETGKGVEKCKVYIFAKSTDNLDKVENGVWKI